MNPDVRLLDYLPIYKVANISPSLHAPFSFIQYIVICHQPLYLCNVPIRCS